jgi:hypothetical protein
MRLVALLAFGAVSACAEIPAELEKLLPAAAEPGIIPEGLAWDARSKSSTWAASTNIRLSRSAPAERFATSSRRGRTASAA